MARDSLFTSGTPTARKRGGNIVQLGNFRMSPGSTAEDAEGPREDGLARAQALLAEALAIIDSIGLPAEIGARLQEVVDLVNEAGER